MPGVARLGDFCTGHSCWPPRANNGASSDSIVNGRGIHRQSDSYPPHSWPPNPPHGAILSSGSSTVIVNGLQCGRCGDPVSCGGSVATCSSNVFAGGWKSF